MRSRFLAVPLIMTLGLGGCTAVTDVAQAATGTISSLAPQAMNDAKKGLTASHSLHEAAADALTIAAKSGLCHLGCAATGKTYLDQSEAYLVVADKLVAVGDAPGIEAKISSATALISQVQALTSGSK